MIAVRITRSSSDRDISTDPETDSESDCPLDYTDKSPMDKKEGNVMQFMSRSCGCSLGNNRQACSKQFTKEQITLYEGKLNAQNTDA